VTILVAPGYAPFEQYYSSGEDQGPWTDIYSLGATCYRAVTGMPPMDAIARSKGILGSTRELLVPASTVAAGRYSERMLKAIDHALAFGEKDRPASIAQWRDELPGSGARASEAPRVAPTAAASASGRAAPTVLVRQPPPLARTAGLIALVAAIAIIGGGFGAYMAMKGTRPEPTAVAVAPEAAAPGPQKKADDERIAGEKAEREAKARKLEEEERLAREKAEREAKAKQAAEDERRRQEEAERVQKKAARPETAKPRPAPKSDPKPESRSEPKPEPPVPPAGEAAAFAHYRGLALKGDPEAAMRVGELFESGRGTATSPNWAYVWYIVAEQRGMAAARAKKDAIGSRLQPKEIEQAERLAKSLMQPAK
jgi:hypothetical protein